MAKEFYGYFDSVDGDERAYDAGQLAHLLKGVACDGVSSHDGGLEVTADGLSMETAVAYGGCIIGGHVYVLEDDGGGALKLTHDPSGSADRYDRVVVRLESEQHLRRMSIAVLTGVPGASPMPPEPTRTALVWELSLAKVRVRAAATVISPEDVTDERGDTGVCGYAVHRRLSEMTDIVGALQRAVDAKASTATYAVTLKAGAWGGGAPYSQTAQVNGILLTDDPFVDVDMSGASGTGKGTALQEAWTLVGRVTANAGSITAYCYEERPTVDLPLILKVVR